MRFFRMSALVGALGAIVPHGLHAQDPEPYRIEGLIITAAPSAVRVSELGNHVTVLDGDALRGEGISDVAEALRGVPGLGIARNGSFGGVTSLFFRGGESDYTLVLIDGVQVNQPGGGFDFAGLTMEAVDRIEVVRGPSSALHGSDAIAGVIHIVTRSGAANSARLEGRVGAGTYGRLDTSLGLSGGGARSSYALGWGRYDTDGILAFNNRHLNTTVNGRVELRPDERSRVAVSGRWGQREFHFPTDFAGAVVDRNQFTFSDEASLSLEATRRWNQRWDVRALFTAFAADGGTEDLPDGPADTLGFYGFQSLDAYRRAAVDVRVGYRAGEDLRWTGGFELERQSVRSFSASLSEFGESGGRDSNERGNRAAYAHVSGAALGGHWSAGVRQEDNERYGGFASAQLSASRKIGSALRVRAAWGRSVKEPTFFETFSSGFAMGNPELDPERADSWEAGAEAEGLDGRLRADVTWFDQRFRDLIQYTASPPVAGGPNYHNVAEARARGIELGVGLDLGAASFRADWTGLDTRVVDSGFERGEGATFVEGASLLRRPDHRVSFSAGTLVRGVRLHGDVHWTGQRDDRDFSTFPASPVLLDAFTLLGVGVDLPLGRTGAALWARGDNILDEAYQDVFGFVAPGRTLRVGARFQLDLR